MPVPLLDTVSIVTSVHVTRRYRGKICVSRTFLWQYAVEYCMGTFSFIKQIFERKLRNPLLKMQTGRGWNKGNFLFVFYISEVFFFFLSNMKLYYPLPLHLKHGRWTSYEKYKKYFILTSAVEHVFLKEIAVAHTLNFLK
jgi:hypothetical protein